MEYGALIYALLPELLLVVAMFAALGVDYTQMRDRSLAARYWVAGWLAALGLLAGLVVTVMQVGNLTASYGEGQLVFTQGTLVIKALLYFMGLCVIPLAVRHTVTPQASEYFALLLLSTAGMGLVATSPMPAVDSSSNAKYSLACGVTVWRTASGMTHRPMKYSSALITSVPCVNTNCPSP